MRTADHPFFSIVIPTYNRAAHLPNALRSILDQQFQDFEIIIIDDGSTDGTKHVIQNLFSQHAKIKYFIKENEERSIARNYGISKATGKYINFLDSDDIVYTNHLTIAYQLLTDNKYPEVGHLGYEFIDSMGNQILVRNNFDQSFARQLIHENIIHGNAIFVRRDIATQINFIPSRFAILSEDWYLWLRLAARYPFVFNNSVTSAVVQHPNRSLMNVDPEKLILNTDTIVNFLQKDEAFMRFYKGRTAYHFASHYSYLTLVLALSKKSRYATLKYLIKAISYTPRIIASKRFLASVKHFF